MAMNIEDILAHIFRDEAKRGERSGRLYFQQSLSLHPNRLFLCACGFVFQSVWCAAGTAFIPAKSVTPSQANSAWTGIWAWLICLTF